MKTTLSYTDTRDKRAPAFPKQMSSHKLLFLLGGMAKKTVAGDVASVTSVMN